MCFRPARYFCLDVLLFEFFSEGFDDLIDVFFPVHATLVDFLGDFPVFLRIQVPEAQIFQFPLDLPDAQPVGQRGEDFQSFFSDSARAGLQEARPAFACCAAGLSV